jgi:PAS domain S-box-containing protein
MKRATLFSLQLVALAALIVAMGLIGLSLAHLHRNVTIVWPASGVALAALLLGGSALWPGLVAGFFIVNIMEGIPAGVAGVIAGGNTLEALLGAFLLRRVMGFRLDFPRLRDVFTFLACGVLIPPLLSATIGVTSLCAIRSAAWDLFGPLWIVWWLGSAIGTLVVTPFALAWRVKPNLKLFFDRKIESVAIGLLFIISGAAVFLDIFHLRISDYPQIFIFFPVLLWATLRFGLHGGTLSTLFLSALAVWGTAHETGPFSQERITLALGLLWTFMAVTGISTLLLAAVLEERRREEASRGEIETEREQVLQRLQLILERMPIACIVLDERFHIAQWNPAAGRVFGFTRGEVLGKHPLEVIVPPDARPAVREVVDRLTAGDPAAYNINENVTRDGRIITCEWHNAPLRGSDGSFLGVISMARDITERVKIEEARRRPADRSSSIGTRRQTGSSGGATSRRFSASHSMR